MVTSETTPTFFVKAAMHCWYYWCRPIKYYLLSKFGTVWRPQNVGSSQHMADSNVTVQFETLQQQWKIYYILFDSCMESTTMEWQLSGFFQQCHWITIYISSVWLWLCGFRTLMFHKNSKNINEVLLKYIFYIFFYPVCELLKIYIQIELLRSCNIQTNNNKIC